MSQMQCLPPSPSFMCPLLPGTLSTESRRPGARLPVPTCCLVICVPGSLRHVGLLPASCLTVLLPAPRAFSQSPSGMTVSDQLVKNNFLSIGVSPVTLACFPVGSSRVVSGRFLSHSFVPAPLARSPACHLDLFPAHSFWLLPAPVHPQRSWGISRPGRESTQLSSCWLLIGVWRPPCTQPLQCPGEHK